jgi:hypothetical protein
MKTEKHLKKTLPDKIKELKAYYPDKVIKVVSMDEARFGLIPIFRSYWAPKGKRPSIPIRLKYEWVYMFSVVEPLSGETFSMIWSTVNTDIMTIFLQEYSKTLKADEICLMIIDGAGWHSEKIINSFDNIICLKQPAYSPECNPTERLWTWVRERLANKIITCPSKLIEELSKIANSLHDLKDIVKSWTNFHWWQKAINRI